METNDKIPERTEFQRYEIGEAFKKQTLQVGATSSEESVTGDGTLKFVQRNEATSSQPIS